MQVGRPGSYGSSVPGTAEATERTILLVQFVDSTSSHIVQGVLAEEIGKKADIFCGHLSAI